jgi:hypothetical protein
MLDLSLTGQPIDIFALDLTKRREERERYHMSARSKHQRLTCTQQQRPVALIHDDGKFDA